MKSSSLLLFIFTVTLLAGTSACHRKTQQAKQTDTLNTAEQPVPAGSPANLPGSSMVADTIVYDVLIRNPNPDDAWTNKCLKGLHHSKLVDSIFHDVYSGRLIPYTIFENRPMTIAEVKALEETPGYSRTLVGKIQFAETWFYDAGSGTFQKKVISIALGYERKYSGSDMVDYKPLFRVYLH